MGKKKVVRLFSPFSGAFLVQIQSAAVVRTDPRNVWWAISVCLAWRTGRPAPLRSSSAARSLPHLPLACSTVPGGGHGSYFAATSWRRLQLPPSPASRLFRRLAPGDVLRVRSFLLFTVPLLTSDLLSLRKVRFLFRIPVPAMGKGRSD